MFIKCLVHLIRGGCSDQDGWNPQLYFFLCPSDQQATGDQAGDASVL